MTAVKSRGTSRAAPGVSIPSSPPFRIIWFSKLDPQEFEAPGMAVGIGPRANFQPANLNDRATFEGCELLVLFPLRLGVHLCTELAQLKRLDHDKSFHFHNLAAWFLLL